MVNVPGLSDRLGLVNRGVPYSVAMKLSANRVLAFTIIFGQHDGGVWNWSAMRWNEPQR